MFYEQTESRRINTVFVCVFKVPKKCALYFTRLLHTDSYFIYCFFYFVSSNLLLSILRKSVLLFCMYTRLVDQDGASGPLNTAVKRHFVIKKWRLTLVCNVCLTSRIRFQDGNHNKQLNLPKFCEILQNFKAVFVYQLLLDAYKISPSTISELK